MENQNNIFNLNEIAGGALAEKVQQEWQKLLDNMQDPNVSFKPVRKLIITLSCAQDETRSVMGLVGDVTTKLAPPQGIIANFSAGKDLDTGKAFAVEYRTIDARQMSLDEAKDVDGYQVNKDGEIINYPDKVVDLRKEQVN